MRISNNYTYRSPYNNPAFGHSSRTVKDACGNLLYRTTTCFYRQDLNWIRFVEFLSSKYKNADKVNVINYACSTGEETFTLITQLLKKLEDAKKFFPIIAKDIDEENIKIASSGLLETYNVENLLMGQRFDGDETAYFKWEDDPENEFVTVKDKVRKNAIFSVADMFEDIKHEPCKNTVLMCRNVWPYFSAEKQEELIRRISEKFVDDSSLLVVGSYDINQGCYHETKGGHIRELLKKYGFVSVGPFDYVYEKLPSKTNYYYVMTNLPLKMP